MSLRFKWSFQQAIQSTLTWTILLLFAAGIFLGENQKLDRAAIVCMLLVIPPILVRWRHFYTMFKVTKIISKNRRIYLEVGHREDFREYYRDAIMASSVVSIPILALDNDMVIAAESIQHLEQAKNVLRAQWPYFTLLDNCDARYDTLVYTNNEDRNPSTRRRHV